MNTAEIQTRRSKESIPLALGERFGRVEEGFLRLGTERVYRFREKHAFWFGLIAYALGSGLVAIFTVMSYGDWAYQGINLKAAVYELVGGAFGGGIAAIFLAFAYARTVRPVLARVTEPRRIRVR